VKVLPSLKPETVEQQKQATVSKKMRRVPDVIGVCKQNMNHDSGAPRLMMMPVDDSRREGAFESESGSIALQKISLNRERPKAFLAIKKDAASRGDGWSLLGF
jgi:hypothetical protein